MNMKKFSLKPLGDSCMNKMSCKGLLFIGLLMTFCLAACSDDNDVTPIFPEKQNMICNAGETKEFTFTANTNWSLTSSAIWCKFQSNDVEEFVVSGKAGAQNVTIVVTDDDQKVNSISVAKLELTMDGQTIVIGEITRSAKEYELEIFNEAGESIKELKVGYQDFSKFTVKANFRFAVTNLPGWVELEGGSLVGAINQKVTGGLKIIEDENREKYPIEASDKNVITFSDEEGKAFYSFKVSYDGMTPGTMELILPSTYPTNWIVSMDGKTFTQKSMSGNTGDITLYKRMPFTIKALNDQYVFVYMEEWEDWQKNKNISVIDPNDTWMHCEGNKGKINLTVDEYTPNLSWGEPESRTGYVLAFLQDEYESIKDNLEETIVENGEIAYKYEQRNLLIGFTQKEEKEESDDQSFIVKRMGYENVSPVKTTNTAILSFLKGNYSIDDVYSISANASEYYMVNPLLSENEWYGEAYVINAYDEDVDVALEPTMDESGKLVLGLTLPDVFDEDLIIVFKGADMLFKKALVITPAN